MGKIAKLGKVHPDGASRATDELALVKWNYRNRVCGEILKRA